MKFKLALKLLLGAMLLFATAFIVNITTVRLALCGVAVLLLCPAAYLAIGRDGFLIAAAVFGGLALFIALLFLAPSSASALVI